MDNSMAVLQKLKTDPAFLLQDIYPREPTAEPQRNICTPMFTTSVLVTAKRWKQPQCPSTNEPKNKMWRRQTMEYYSASIREGDFDVCCYHE